MGIVFFQCCGSVSIWYGSGPSDPFREITDPDPAPNLRKYQLFFYKNIFLPDPTDKISVADAFNFDMDPRIRFVRQITDPDPAPNPTWDRENTNFLKLIFFY